jgi:hypothetical protein
MLEVSRHFVTWLSLAAFDTPNVSKEANLVIYLVFLSAR